MGPLFVGTETHPKLLEVSANGKLQCSYGNEHCPNYSVHKDRKIVVEIKSPFPQENIAKTLFYEIPNRYVPQIQAEMRAYNCTELWLICSTPISATVISAQFDQKIWKTLWNLTCELYNKQKPKIPTKLHPAIKELKLAISKRKKTSSKILCEVPTVTREYGNITIAPDFSSPYSPAPGRIHIEATLESVTTASKNLSLSSKAAFEECHEVLRDPGKELVVLMITDKDRKQEHNVPYSFPVAYALKGSSMSNDHLHFMVDKVRNELQKRNIPILCETYDGQWHKHISESRNGQRLPQFHGRELWNKMSGLSKDKCLEQINTVSCVKSSSLERLSNARLLPGQGIMFPGIRIEKSCSGELNTLTESQQMNKIHSITPITWPDLFVSDTCSSDGNSTTPKFVSIFQADEIETPGTSTKQKLPKTVGLQENENSILDILKPMYSISLDIENANADSFENEEDMTDNLENILKNTQCALLKNILNEPVNCNSEKWLGKTVDDLFPELLTNGDNLCKQTTVKELQIICNEMRFCTGRVWSSSNMLKADIANSIVKAFGGTQLTLRQSNKKMRRNFNPETLVQIRTNYVKSTAYPVQQLQVPLATCFQIANHDKWISQSPVCLYGTIPAENETARNETIEFFSYPEYNKELTQIEFRTFDFTHILTNLRTQILTRRLEYCKKEHFEHLSTNRSDILSLALVIDKIDQQNAFTAMRMFNYDVEKYMYENGFVQTGNFVKLVRNWHNACNMRGISADERVQHLYAMHKFLTHDINFNSMPFEYSGRYVRGLTWQTFEAILQTISTRIQLYAFSNGNTYNTRAVSTLANESFFADLVQYDKESHGYPKGPNVSRVFGHVVLLNHFKHKRNKNYFLSATIKNKYEIKLEDDDWRRYITESAYEYNGFYRNHFFDYPNMLKSHRVRRDDITMGIAALRTTDGVRRWYRTVEGDILSEIRGGNQIKGFTLSKNIY